MRRRALTVGVVSLCAALGFARENYGGSRQSVLASAPAAAQAVVNPYEGNAEAVRTGRRLYARHCAECHGADARGTDWAPALVTSTVRLAPAGGLLWFLTNGNRRAGMPSWSRLPDARRWQIVTFLKSVDAAPTPEQP